MSFIREETGLFEGRNVLFEGPESTDIQGEAFDSWPRDYLCHRSYRNSHLDHTTLGLRKPEDVSISSNRALVSQQCVGRIWLRGVCPVLSGVGSHYQTSPPLLQPEPG